MAKLFLQLLLFNILFREYLKAGGTAYLDAVFGEGNGAMTVNVIETAYDLSTNPIGTLIGGITNQLSSCLADNNDDVDNNDDGDDNDEDGDNNEDGDANGQ